LFGAGAAARAAVVEPARFPVGAVAGVVPDLRLAGAFDPVVLVGRVVPVDLSFALPRAADPPRLADVERVLDAMSCRAL